MRVVSWNLWWRFGGNWREREPHITAALSEIDPHIVGLQEVWGEPDTSQADLLAGWLGLHAAFAAPSLPHPPVPVEAPDQDGVRLGVAVLSRWPIIDTAVHPLPAVHRDPAIALRVTVAHPEGRLHVVAAAVEWEPAFADDHLAQTRALADIVTDPSLDGALPVLLTADLNAPPDSREVQALTDVMVDTWEAAGEGDGVTLTSANPFAPKEALRQIDQRIDYVLARPGTAESRVTVESAFVADHLTSEVPPSDHSAVVVDLLV